MGRGAAVPRADGTTEFRPHATGVRVVNKRVVKNDKPGKEKLGEVLVKPSYVVRQVTRSGHARRLLRAKKSDKPGNDPGPGLTTGMEEI